VGLLTLDSAKRSAPRGACRATSFGESSDICSHVFTQQQSQTTLRDNALVMVSGHKDEKTYGTAHRNFVTRQRPGYGNGISEYQPASRLEQTGPFGNDLCPTWKMVDCVNTGDSIELAVRERQRSSCVHNTKFSARSQASLLRQ